MDAKFFLLRNLLTVVKKQYSRGTFGRSCVRPVPLREATRSAWAMQKEKEHPRNVLRLLHFTTL